MEALSTGRQMSGVGWAEGCTAKVKTPEDTQRFLFPSGVDVLEKCYPLFCPSLSFTFANKGQDERESHHPRQVENWTSTPAGFKERDFRWALGRGWWSQAAPS